MTLMNWTAPQYSTGVEFADLEHQGIFARLNALYDSLQQEKTRDEIGQHLDELIRYASAHFAHEEQEMAAHNFPGYLEHQKEHQSMLDICNGVQTQFRAETLDMAEDVCLLFKNWFQDHIITFDKDYAPALTRSVK